MTRAIFSWPSMAAFLVALSSAALNAAAPVITGIAMSGQTLQLTIDSDLVITNHIQYSTSLAQPDWTELTNLLVAQTPYQITDPGAAGSSQRFYRIVASPIKPPAPAGMTLIPSGPFLMGDALGDSTREGFPGELPTHTVTVSAFYIDTNLVSFNLWEQVYEWSTTNGYDFTYGDTRRGKGGNYPVAAIWYHAVMWCNARSEMEGLAPCYYTDSTHSNVYRGPAAIDLTADDVDWAANGYRLPTEAEWEKAARGGVAGHRFPWRDVDTIDWTRANFYSYPGGYDINPTGGYDPAFATGSEPYNSPVGSFAPNGYGLFDMAGNIIEWCWDWFDPNYYAVSAPVDPRGSSSSCCGSRTGRGSGWNYHGAGARCSFRFSAQPWNNYAWMLGFRSVRAF